MKVSTALAATLLALAPLAMPGTAHAATIGFTYAGSDPDNPYIAAAGSGTISFNGTGTLTLASLTGFSFAQTTTLSDPALTGAGRFAYALTDLTSFSATVANGTFSALSLRTRTTADPAGFLADESFQIRSLRANGASTAFDNAGSDQATLGTISLVAAVPEPATWSLVALGMAGLGLRRRTGAAHPA